MPDALDTLDDALLAAHSEGNLARLSELYGRAADLCEAAGREEAACFYLTHAYVFALDGGVSAAGAFHARLRARGREE